MKLLLNIIKKFKIIISILLLLIIIPFSGFTQNQNNFEISKNLDIYTTLFKELNINYVDEISSGELMETGIDAMLKSLDPYTIFIPESEVEDYRFITTGQYGGIGALIHKQGDYIVISEPYKDMPAYKAGLKAGDKILKIDNKPLKGKKSSEISTILKGQPGTTIKILIERYDNPEPIEKEITREVIKIDNISYYGMLNNHIGYIKLSSFTQKAGKEVKDAFIDLKNNNDLKGIILDLRNNGGGLLHEAVNISNIYIEKGQLIVSTKGKLNNKNKSYRTLYSPADINIPIVILVNNSSASASEIVAGAMQDLDRGVVIGQKTFGKGLVQNVVPISYNSQAKITVAKYYIPSSRCIQAIDYSHKDENGISEKIPDSLITAFQTKNGRTVYDGGGIEPDIVIEPPKYSNITLSLLTNYLIFDYGTKFHKEHPEIDTPDKFQITNAIYEDFLSFISDKDYEYTTESEETLKKLQKATKNEKYFNAIKPEFEALEKKIMHNKKEDIKKSEEEIKKFLKIEIVSRYYYQKGRIITSFSDDPEIEKAIEVLDNSPEYYAILNGTNKENTNNKE
ncbi:MAG: S41 family peptidase [Bacteroidales bacterium]|nr:S41 family peptidase [Bacteroidales bacterium]